MRSFATESHAASARAPAAPAPVPSFLGRTPLVRTTLRGARLQPKLTIGAVDDSAEHEADRVADQVMRMSERTVAADGGKAPGNPVSADGLQRKCACGGSAGPAGECAACAARRQATLRHPVADQREAAPALVHDALGTPGRPLDDDTRGFMEGRFGRNFSHVHVHTDATSERSAQAVGALAYTVGDDVVFNAGEYAPKTTDGRRLIAHELAHTLQQGGAGSAVLQRACGPAEVGEPEGCTFSADDVSGPRYLFRVNCDEFATGNEEDLRVDAASIVNGEIVEIHGIASIDGDADFNWHLSCARALRARAVIEAETAARGITATIRVFHHGARPGDATLQRSVVLVRTAPSQLEHCCGPDATDWFIDQVNAAKADPIILALQRRLTGAERLARRYGFSAERIAEGAVSRRVLAEEARVHPPPRTPEARSQLAASLPGQRALGRAVMAATMPLVGAPEAYVLAAIRSSALIWKGLVGTGMKYDFKNSARTLGNPQSAHCPVNCAGTVTLCPTTGSDCFIKDVPGNLFFAHVGRFVGWTELALQLGSEFAQLEASARWDPPEDTRMISFGFALPDPLTRTNLCSAINANRTVFNLQSCTNCSEGITADVV